MVKASQAAKDESKARAKIRAETAEGGSSVEEGGSQARAVAAAVEGTTEMELAAKVLSQLEYRLIRVLYPVASSTLAGWSVLRAGHRGTPCAHHMHMHITCTHTT